MTANVKAVSFIDGFLHLGGWLVDKMTKKQAKRLEVIKQFNREKSAPMIDAWAEVIRQECAMDPHNVRGNVIKEYETLMKRLTNEIGTQDSFQIFWSVCQDLEDMTDHVDQIKGDSWKFMKYADRVTAYRRYIEVCHKVQGFTYKEEKTW